MNGGCGEDQTYRQSSRTAAAILMAARGNADRATDAIESNPIIAAPGSPTGCTTGAGWGERSRRPIASPRPFYVSIESKVGAATLDQLRALGHDVRPLGPRTSTFGFGQAVMSNGEGVHFGASDPRHDGAAIPQGTPRQP